MILSPVRPESVGAVITAKNEADTIGELVYRLRKQGLSVCVIDDGSTDDTGRVARLCDAHVIRHDESRGIRDSLIEAWRYAIEQGWEQTVQIDAGGSHDPLEWNKTEWAGDIIVGSRFMPASEYVGRKWRAIASRIVAGLLNWATHQKISDWTSGYRVFSRRALQALVDVNYLTRMHTWQIEVLGEAINKGFTVAEFPITYRAGDSSMKAKTVLDLFTVYLWIMNR